MFKDTEKELKRLEEELLEEEQTIPTDTDELLAQLHKELDEEPVQAYNADHVDTDVQEFGEQVESPAKEKLTGLVIAAVALTVGILGIVAWWLVRLLG